MEKYLTTTQLADILEEKNYSEEEKKMDFISDNHRLQLKERIFPKYDPTVDLRRLRTDKEYRDNLNSMNQYLGSTKRLLKEIYFESCNPSSDSQRLARLEEDFADVLRGFLIKARIRHQTFIEWTRQIKGDSKNG
jgi:hypothetical protein